MFEWTELQPIPWLSGIVDYFVYLICLLLMYLEYEIKIYIYILIAEIDIFVANFNQTGKL